ncbi:MAG: HAMP domain-containing histidine kinase [Bdellovibrionales bacterium]|nr:HAMP domain-containing histidine kinase [Bdellovibrionales bacterium]
MHSSTETPTWFLRLRFVAASFMALLVFWDSYPKNLSVFWGIFGLLLISVPLSHFVSLASPLSSWRVHFLLLVDTVLLTIVLSLTGGAANPFSIVYLVYVVLAALLLGKWWTWGLAFLTSGCFLSLFLFVDSAAMTHMHGGAHLAPGNTLSHHLSGMLFSYILVVMLVAFFVSKIIDELRKRELALGELSASQDKLLSLTTLSAHAAHELGSPLGTIDVITHELLKSMNGEDIENTLQEDLNLLSCEVQRCKKIIQKLCHQSGAVAGEMPQECSLDSLKDLLENELDTTKVQWHLSDPAEFFCLPLSPLLAALKGLLANALDASKEVRCSFALVNSRLECVIRDHGDGMSNETLRHLGQPFFSSKKDGMGLGVHIAQLVAQQFHGELTFESTQGNGTMVMFSVPAVFDLSRSRAA